jgi:hypothetical protein
MHLAAKGMPTAVDSIAAGARRELLGRGATANLGEHVGDPIPSAYCSFSNGYRMKARSPRNPMVRMRPKLEKRPVLALA